MEPIDLRIHNEEDFVNVRRFSFSLKKLLDRYPDGVPDRYIAQALNIKEDDVNPLYMSIVTKLRSLMQVEV